MALSVSRRIFPASALRRVEAARVFRVGELVLPDLLRGLACPDGAFKIEPDSAIEGLAVHRPPFVLVFSKTTLGVVAHREGFCGFRVQRETIRAETRDQVRAGEYVLLERILDSLLAILDAEVLQQPAMAENVNAVVQAPETDRDAVRFPMVQRGNHAFTRGVLHQRTPMRQWLKALI